MGKLRHVGVCSSWNESCLCTGLAGFLGLVWLRWNSFDYDPERFFKALEISVKVAGLTPHSKVSSHVLSLIPIFILIGYLAYYAKLTSALFSTKTLVNLGSRRISCFNCFCHCRILHCFRCLCSNCCGFCTYSYTRDA